MGRNGNGPRKSVKKRKELGRVAQASIIHNYTLVEDYLKDIRAGSPTPYRIARVEKAHGGGAFDVQILGEGHTVRAKLRQLMHGRGRFYHNPDVTTAARVGGYVIVEDIGLGHMGSGVTHQIMGVPDMKQASDILRVLGIVDEKGPANAYYFRHSSNTNSNVDNLGLALAGLGITPTYARRQMTLRSGKPPAKTNRSGATGGGATGGGATGGAGRSSSSSRKSSSSSRFF